MGKGSSGRVPELSGLWALCKIVQGFRIGVVHILLGHFLPGHELAVRGFDIDRGLTYGAQRLGDRFCRGFENRQGCAGFERGGGVRTIEDFIEDTCGFGSALDGMLMPDERLFANGEFHFAREGGDAAAPVADGVAVNAGFRSGVRNGLTFGEK